MDKVIKLASVVQLLRKEARDIKERIYRNHGIDNDCEADLWKQHDGYIASAKLIEKNVEQLA